MMPARRRRSKSCLVSRSRIIKNSRYQWECKDKDGVQIVLGQMHLRHTVSCHFQSKLLSSWFPADFPCPLSLHLFADRCKHVLIMLLRRATRTAIGNLGQTTRSAALLHCTCFLEPTTYLATDLPPVHPTSPGTTCSIETGRDRKPNQPYLLGLPIRKRN